MIHGKPMRAAAAAACVVLSGFGAFAAELRIGIAAPLSGPMASLGEQLRDGAWEAIRQASGATTFLADDQCDETGGARAARQFVDNNVSIVVGFLCTEAAEAALPTLRDARIPVISPGVRTDSLTTDRDRNGYLFYRVAPRAGAEAAAVAELLIRRWRDDLFAIVDDGTIYGRELAEGLRFSAEQDGLKPAFVDTYRPQLDNQIALVGRLRRAGATHVFIGGDRDDIATIARDAASLDYDLVVAGGEALRAAGQVPLTPGTMMIGLPDWSEEVDPAIAATFRQRQIEPEGYVIPSYAAAQIALEAAGTGDAASMRTSLAEDRFETAIGPVKFDSNGDLSENPYRLFRWDGVRFVEVK